MNFIFSFISIIVGSIIFHYLGAPWWCIALASGLAAFQFKLSPLYSFICGFVAIFCLWLAHAMFLNNANEGQLLKSISEVMSLSSNTIWILMLSIGSLIGGLAALSGSLFRLAFLGDPNTKYKRRKSRH